MNRQTDVFLRDEISGVRGLWAWWGVGDKESTNVYPSPPTPPLPSLIQHLSQAQHRSRVHMMGVATR